MQQMMLMQGYVVRMQYTPVLLQESVFIFLHSGRIPASCIRRTRSTLTGVS